MIISYLNASEPFAMKKRAMFSWCILLFWLAVVVGVSGFHEMWRDEVLYREAIILGEPDMRLESLPYYTENPIYLSREGR